VVHPQDDSGPARPGPVCGYGGRLACGGVADPFTHTVQRGSSVPQPKKPFSWQTLVVLFLSTVQAISSAGLALIAAYKSVRETVRLVHASHAAKTAASPPPVEEKQTHMQTPPGSRSSSTPPLLRSYTSGSTLDELPLPSPHATVDGPPDYTRGALDFITELLTLRERFGSAVLLSFLSGSSSAAQPFLSKSAAISFVQRDTGADGCRTGSSRTRSTSTSARRLRLPSSGARRRRSSPTAGQAPHRPSRRPRSRSRTARRSCSG
jgi:hypothetical protein